MSTLTGSAESAAEVTTGARKKTKKSKLPRSEETPLDPVREQLQALSVNCTVPNGTTDHENVLPVEHPSSICGSSTSENVNNDQVCDDHCSEHCATNLQIINNIEVALGHLEGAFEEHRKAAAAAAAEEAAASAQKDEVEFVSYESELQMAEIMRLIQKDLSEPYSIYTFRYFIHNWPKLCFLAMHDQRCIGAIVCKLDLHREARRGYIAMLAVDEKYRKRKIGSKLVRQAIQAMIADNADEVVLETEITNKPALRLYENLGFVRDKRLFRYYLNGVDALRLKLWLR